MKILSAAAVALLLAGCATSPKYHFVKAPAVVTPSAPVAQPDKPATFKERFKKFSGRLKWVHSK